MMSDRFRQGAAYLIAMGMVIAVASAPTVAQTADENAERVFEAAGVSVDQVDGLDAMKYTTNKVKRAGKIVATNANGVLPSNIVKPQWRVIQNLPASFTDGRIGWYEVANKPASFADNVDDAGVTGIRIKEVRVNTTVASGKQVVAVATCPTGFLVTGGGITQAATDLRIVDSSPNGPAKWLVSVLNLGSTNREFSVYAMCLATTPAGALTPAGK